MNIEVLYELEKNSHAAKSYWRELVDRTVDKQVPKRYLQYMQILMELWLYAVVCYVRYVCDTRQLRLGSREVKWLGYGEIYAQVVIAEILVLLKVQQ